MSILSQAASVLEPSYVWRGERLKELEEGLASPADFASQGLESSHWGLLECICLKEAFRQGEVFSLATETSL